MANAKFVKTAAAVALGTSVVATAVAPSASAATTYKIKSGKLVNAKTGKVVKGYKTYKSVLYKDGKKYTGLRSGKFYKKGVLATGTYKGVKYKKGAKFTGVSTNGKFYKNGVVGTGTYKGVKYKKGVEFTGVSTNGKYYEDGVLATGTKVVDGTLYTDGVKDTKTQVFENVLYVEAKKATGIVTFEDVVYIDGVKDTEAPVITAEDKTVEYGADAVDVLSLVKVEDNSKEDIKATAKITFDGKEVNAINTKQPGVYTVTYSAKDVNGNEAEAKEIKITVAEATEAAVDSVEAVNGTTLVIKFSKALDKDAATTVDANGVSKVVTLENTTLKNPTLSEDGKTLTLESVAGTGSTTLKAIEADQAKLVVDEVLVKGSTTEKSVKYTTLFTYKDTVAPTAVGAKAALAKVTDTTTNTVTVTFSEPVQASAIATVNGSNVSVAAGEKSNELKLTTSTALKAGDAVEIKLTNVRDIAGNAITPNPSTISTTVEAADAVAPTIASVTTKGTDKVIVTFNKEIDNAAATLKKSAYLSINGQKVANVNEAAVDGKEVTYTLADESGTSFSGLFSEKNPTVTATLFIPKEDVSDLAGNKFASDYSTSVTFTKDYVKPTVVASNVVDNKLVLNFSEAVAFKSGATKQITLYETNLVTGNTSTTPITVTLDDTVISKDGKTVTIDLNDKADASKEVSYVVEYAADLFVDEANNGVDKFSKTITLAKKATTPTDDKVAPTIVTDSSGYITLDNDSSFDAAGTEYKIVYSISDDEALDFASIRNLNNYTFAGQALPADTKITTDAENTEDKNVKVTLTIPKKSVTQTLTGVFAISGIQDAAGNTVSGILTTNPDTAELKTLAEGVAPTVKSAVAYKADNKLVVEFSEDVATLVEADFKVSVNGATGIAPTAIAKATGADAGTGKYEFTLPAGELTAATKVEISTIAEPTSEDAANNKLKALTEAITATLK